MSSNYTQHARALYETGHARRGKDKIDIAAKIADETEAFVRNLAAKHGLSCSKCDEAENLVMYVFEYIMNTPSEKI